MSERHIEATEIRQAIETSSRWPYRDTIPDEDEISRGWRWRKSQHQPDLDLEAIYQECSKAQNLLLEAANKYLKKAKQPNMVIDSPNNWTTVQESLEKACLTLDQAAARDKDVSGFTGRLKKGFHGLCRNAGAGKLFTALIPNNGFGSTLCGGLNIVFAALEQTGYHREAVYDALVQLPDILDNLDEYIEMVPDDTELHRRTAKLYSEVCLTLEHIMNWFTTNAFVVGATRLLNPRRSSARLKDRMAHVTLAAENFKSYASRLMFKRQEDLLRMQASSSHDHQTMAHCVREIDRKMQWLVERCAVFDNIQFNVLERLQPFLRGEMQLPSPGLVSQHSPVPSAAVDPALLVCRSPEITAETVMEALLYDENLRKKDLQAILNLGIYSSGSKPDAGRVQAIQGNAQLRAWLTIDISSDHQTPLRSTESPAMIITLAYFCDRHRNYRRDVAGSPTELGMSLMLQLIDRYRMFDSSDLASCLQETDPDDLGSIICSFGRLISRLPSNAVVFLFVDGLYWFTTPPERQRTYMMAC